MLVGISRSEACKAFVGLPALSEATETVSVAMPAVNHWCFSTALPQNGKMLFKHSKSPAALM